MPKLMVRLLMDTHRFWRPQCEGKYGLQASQMRRRRPQHHCGVGRSPAVSSLTPARLQQQPQWCHRV